jgi:agmatine deiminase
MHRSSSTILISTLLVLIHLQFVYNYVFPGEFEEMQSVWMAFPLVNHTQHSSPFTVQVEMMKTLLAHNNAHGEKFYIDYLVHGTELNTVKTLLENNGIQTKFVRFHEIPYVSIWLRDMGPIFVRDDEAHTLKVVDFGFNEWSYANALDDESLIDEQVDRLAAKKLNLPLIRSSLISEGGDREFNGKGTLFLSEVVELQRNRNQGFTTKEQIEQEMIRVLGLKKIVWFGPGLADDELSYYGKIPDTDLYTTLATGGHLDEFIRFTNATTVLLTEISEEEKEHDPVARITYNNMQKNLELLQEATDQDGKSFDIVRVPAVPTIIIELTEEDYVYQYLAEMKMKDGSTIRKGEKIRAVLAASYLNFLVANHVVLIPKYGKEGRDPIYFQKDEEARRIFEQVFPGRTVIQIDTDAINEGGGGMHCITQQMPKVDEVIPLPDSTHHDEL